MKDYEIYIQQEVKRWSVEINAQPKPLSKVAKDMQNRMNALLPDKAHEIITEAIKGMVEAVLFGSKYVTRYPLKEGTLEEREQKIKESLKTYKAIAMASGWGTGAGGIFLGLADFPILLSIKMKCLFDIASLYGVDVMKYRERVFILYVFLIAFSSQECRREVYKKLENWEEYSKTIKEEEFDWRRFQQEYRDYIDVAKLLQLLPGIGALVGAYTNNKLMEQLGVTAMNAYRLRFLRGNMLKDGV